MRVRWRGPDLLGQALTAYRRAIGAHRRLARLAPHHFDTAVVERERRAREEQRRWMDTWEPALEKAYGPPTPAEREARRLAELQAGQPPPLSPGVVRRVDAELAACQLWLTIGQQAFAQYQKRYPHDLPSLSRLARLLDIGFTLARLAVGLDESPSASTPPTTVTPDWEEQLRRAYGGPDQSHAAPPAASPPVPPAVVPVVEVDPPLAAPPAIASVQSVTPVPRCDAWNRLARQLRRSGTG